MSFSRSCRRHCMAVPFIVILLLTGVWPSYGQNSGIQLNVLEGEGAINNVRTHTGHDPLVEVRDQSGTPVAAVSVTFQLPGSGAGGTFAGSQNSVVAQTDERGQAVARSLRPNSVSGPFEIRVTASYKGETASAVITQTNAAPAEAKSSKKYWIIALVAGAGAGGAFAATHSSKSSSTQTTTQPGIVAGSPSFGAPH
jgi:hypothetical protein